MNRSLVRKGGTVLLILVIIPFVIFAVPQAVGASNSYVVLSDSMSPSINAGDVVFVGDTSPDEIDEGDVITYERPGESQLITHRVIEVQDEGGETTFRTQGDANEEPDPNPIPAGNVIGVVIFHLPLLGHAISFAGSDLGIVFFVIVPAVGLVVSELYDLYKDATAGSVEGGGGE